MPYSNGTLDWKDVIPSHISLWIRRSPLDEGAMDEGTHQPFNALSHAFSLAFWTTSTWVSLHRLSTSDGSIGLALPHSSAWVPLHFIWSFDLYLIIRSGHRFWRKSDGTFEVRKELRSNRWTIPSGECTPSQKRRVKTVCTSFNTRRWWKFYRDHESKSRKPSRELDEEDKHRPERQSRQKKNQFWRTLTGLLSKVSQTRKATVESDFREWRRWSTMHQWIERSEETCKWQKWLRRRLSTSWRCVPWVGNTEWPDLPLLTPSWKTMFSWPKSATFVLN